jgi:hypothetical protein
VEEAVRGAEAPIFSIWGSKLVELWAAATVPGERTLFRDREGVLAFVGTAPESE